MPLKAPIVARKKTVLKPLLVVEEDELRIRHQPFQLKGKGKKRIIVASSEQQHQMRRFNSLSSRKKITTRRGHTVPKKVAVVVRRVPITLFESILFSKRGTTFPFKYLPKGVLPMDEIRVEEVNSKGKPTGRAVYFVITEKMIQHWNELSKKRNGK